MERSVGLPVLCAGGGGADRGLGGGDVGEPVGVAGSRPRHTAGGDAAAPPAVRAGGGVPASGARPGAHRHAARHGVMAWRLKVRGERGEALTTTQLHAAGPGTCRHHGLASVDLDHPPGLTQLSCEAVGNIGDSACLVTSNTGVLAAGHLWW